MGSHGISLLAIHLAILMRQCRFTAAGTLPHVRRYPTLPSPRPGRYAPPKQSGGRQSNGGGISMAARAEVVAATRERYAASGRAAKGVILNESVSSMSSSH
jgi:hypothetical protein